MEKFCKRIFNTAQLLRANILERHELRLKKWN